MAELLLDALEPLLPCSLPHSLLRKGRFIVSNVRPEYFFFALFSKGQVRLVPPGSTGFCFYFCLSRRAEVWLLSMRGGVMAFLGLSYFLRALHLPSELLYFPYQALVGETECLHLVCVIVYSFQRTCRRSAI